LAWIALAMCFYFYPGLMLGRSVSLIALPLALTLMVGWRVSIHWFLGHPDFGERILIVGSGNLAVEVAREVLNRPDAGYRIIGFVGNDAELLGKSLINPRVIGLTEQLDQIVKRENIDRIVVAMGERRGQLPTNKLLQLSLTGEVSIEEGQSFYERITGRVSLNMLRPSWLIFAGRRKDSPMRAIFREGVHRGLALAGLVLSLPVAILAAIAVKLESRGPLFYKQERVGKNGKIFNVIKFRSMKDNAEADGTPIWAVSNDERVTRVGRVIRKLRIDEIPQFWNILKGEMNFVGPRPERPHFVRQLATELGPFGITVNTVAPGFLRTSPDYEPQWEGWGAEGQKAFVERIAMRRMGTPEDIAHAVMFLASDYASWITGQILPVMGSPN